MSRPMITKQEPPLQTVRQAHPGQKFSTIVEAYFALNQLKQLYRQGWLRRGLPAEHCETVAEHVFAMAMLAGWLVDSHFPTLNRDTVLRMTLIHELGEIYAGDLIPADGVPAPEKHRRERAAIQQVVEGLPEAEAYLALWEEFEQGRTPEACFVRQVDRLEMAFQAAVYASQGSPNMAEFLASADAAITDPCLRDLLAEIKPLVGGTGH